MGRVGDLKGRFTARTIAYVCVVIPFAVASVELGLRGRILFNDHHRFDGNGLFRYEANTQVGPTSELTTNNHGFFGPSMAPGQDEAQYRVVILGSSVVTTPDLARAVTDALQPRIPDRTVLVNTAGIPRYTSYHNLLLLKHHVLPLNPDCVVLYLGLNDNVYNTFPHRGAEPYDGFYDPTDFTRSVLFDILHYQAVEKRFRVRRHFEDLRSADIFERNVRAMIDLAHANGVRVILMPVVVSWPTGDPDLAAIIRANEGPMSHFWGNLDSALRGLDTHRAILRQLGVGTGAGWCDAEPLLAHDASVFRDLCHLTPMGITTLGRTMADCITKAN